MRNLFPYTDAHELNLDWVVEQVKVNDTKVKDLTNTVINMHLDFDSKADKATTYTKTEVNTLLAAKADTSSLATVATSGNYNDLINKPTIPPAQVNSDWNANTGVAEILNKPTLATVATSGSYNDLLNKPTIPAAQVNADWNANSGVAQILNKPTIPAPQLNTDWNAVSGVQQLLNKPANLFNWTLKQLNNEQDLTIKLNNVTFGNWTRYCVFYLCSGGGLLDFGIFLCLTANGVGNVTYNPIIQSTNPPSVRNINIDGGKMDFTIRRNQTYDRMYLSMPEGGITVT